VTDERCRRSYAELDDRVSRGARVLRQLGVGHGNRVAILSENRAEYLELLLAGAQVGAVLACQNWRLAGEELRHCLELVEPALIVTSPRFRERIDATGGNVLILGDSYERRIADADPREVEVRVAPDDPFLILYTSGTTGFPKGATLSHRAQLARYRLVASEFEVTWRDTFLAWPPFFHLVGLEPSIAALLGGGKVIVHDGFDPARLAEVVEEEPLGWLKLVPGMVRPLVTELKRRGTVPRGVVQCGSMADLVPPHQIAEITRLLDAPFVNSFGSTEAGLPPASSGLIPVGVVPDSLSKVQTRGSELRLVDEEGRDVPDGTPGEAILRGPTLFSGYWNDEKGTARALRDGWFHSGDVLVRNSDGTLDFVDRRKYLIKTGGENVYPAEIERVLLADPGVDEAVVIRRADEQWGEVPIALVATVDDEVTTENLAARCRRELAGYKQPGEIHLVDRNALPRGTTGKILRGEVEALFTRGDLR